MGVLETTPLRYPFMYFQPLLAFCVTLLTTGVLVSRWKSRAAQWLIRLATFSLILISYPPIAYLLARPLEGRYPHGVRDFSTSGAGAVVVLASNVFPPGEVRPYSLADRDTYVRCVYAAWVTRHLPGTPVVACGGKMEGAVEAFSRTMAHVLEGEGVPKERIVTEERSQSTYENAVYAAGMLKERGVRRIVLVTEGHHMLRSELVFQKQGLEVIPAPCNFTSFESDSVEGWLPSWKAIFQNERTLHEAAGLVWYRLKGRI